MHACKALIAAAMAACFISTAALAADPSNESQYPAWYQPPQLFVMTGFIANTTSGTWGLDFIGTGYLDSQEATGRSRPLEQKPRQPV